MVLETKGTVWVWQDTDGKWVEYAEDVVKKIEDAYSSKKGKGDKAITVGKDKYSPFSLFS